MSNSPLVTIITPYYNSELFFEETFNSVVNQTFKDFEWIIVDDCSKNDSFSFLSEITSKDSRIKIIKMNENSGTPAARNAGLDNASGKYITMLDADDILETTYLESQVGFIKNNGPLITSYYKIKSDKGTRIFKTPAEFGFKENLKQNKMSSLTTMFDREVFGNIRYRKEFKKSEDFVFWLEMLKTGTVCKSNPNVLATYIIHSGSRSSQKLKCIKYNFRVYHKICGFNVFKSLYYVFQWAIYGIIKYKKIL